MQSSDEEEGEGEEKKKKRAEKKGLKDKIKEKIGGGDKEEEKKLEEKKHEEKKHEEKKHEDTCIPVERYEEEVVVQKLPVPEAPLAEPAQAEEKKGFLEKIKGKLPGHGQHKKPEEVPSPRPPSVAEYTTSEPPSHQEGDVKEKKGILEKIKEKIPGYHPKTEEEKEKERESAAY